MTNIVERLRNTLTGSDGARQTLNEAADEIERLRGLYEREHAYGHAQTQLLESAEARLAEAVELLKPFALYGSFGGEDCYNVRVRSQDARAARAFVAKLEGRS